MKSSEFANAIYTLYPPFRQWDDVTLKAWTDTIVSECGDGAFSSEMRAQAFKTLTRVKHKDKPPQTATIFEHCREAKRWLDAEKGKGELSVGPAPANQSYLDWTEDAFKLSRDLMSGPMGLQAAKEGWIGCLDAYCRKFKRLPPEGEIPNLKRKAVEVDEAYQSCVRGGWGNEPDAIRMLNAPINRRLASMGEDIMAKRNKLIDWRLSLR